MATVDKAEELLEKLRAASWDAAVQGSFFICTLLFKGLMWSKIGGPHMIWSSRVLFWNNLYKLEVFVFIKLC